MYVFAFTIKSGKKSLIIKSVMIARCPSRRMYSPITQSSNMVLDKRKNDYVFNTRWLSYASSYEI